MLSVHHANKCLWAKGLQSVAEVAEGKSIQLKFIPISCTPLESRRAHVQPRSKFVEAKKSMDRGGAQARTYRDVSDECILAELDAKANQKRSPRRSRSRDNG